MSRGGGYRTPLYTMLTELGYNVDLVGTNTANPSQILRDAGEINHQGHGGWWVSHAEKGLFEHLPVWAPAIEAPHVVLVHVGTNDTGDANNYPHVIEHYDALADRLVDLYPNAYIVLTTLLERDPADRNELIHTCFNPYVQGVVDAQVAKGHTRVRFLDMNSKLTLDDMPMDHLHPDDSGYAKMAAAWVPVIQSLYPDPTDIATPPPALLTATLSESRTTIKAVFNESVDKTSAETLANYTLTGTARQLTSAELAGDNRTLTLCLAAALDSAVDGVKLAAANVLSADGTAASQTEKTVGFSTPRGAYRNVPADEVGRYQLVYAMDLPARNAVFQNEHVPYDVDESATTPKFSRVAYYLELRKPGQPLEYLWVSMDAFTNDPLKIGIPTLSSRAKFQQYVTNLKIFSNSANVKPGTREQGNIEFWPYNYATGNKIDIPGADAGAFDFGDEINSGGDYGSMQVHDFANKTTLFGYNRWGGGGANCQQGLGIGSCQIAGAAPDWTHVENSESYDIRRLEVYVMPDETDLTPPQIESAVLGLGRKTVTVTFDKPVSEAGLNKAFQVGAYGVASAKRLPMSRTDHRATRVYLTLDTVVPATETDLVLTVGGVRDTSPRANAVPAGTTVAIQQGGVGLPSELGTVDAALTAGYKLLYTVDVPVKSDWPTKQDALYTVNECGPDIGPFDRVAYYYELDKQGTGSTFAWVSMDAWSQDARQLGVPSAKQDIKQGGFFVHNLVVASNGGAQAVSGAEGYLEFWPMNYETAKQTVVPGQAAGVFDMGDTLSWGGNYGCMQVHNVTGGQTVFAINHFGGDGFTIATGIGPSVNEGGGKNSTDWTFRENAGDYVARRLHVLVHPCAKVEPPEADVSVPADVTDLVADAADYKLLYKVNVPAAGAYFGDANKRKNYYAVDNRDKLPANAARVAYLLKLTDGNGTRWAWTAFDMPATSLAALDVPLNSMMQCKVSHMDVFSNVEGIVTGRDIATGNIEFGSGNYEKGAPLGVGDGSIYDCDDTVHAGNGHGCMQVHNWGEKQQVWGISHFNNDSEPGLFIGNETSNNQATDGTFTYNGSRFTARELYVMVKYADTAAPAEVVARVPDAANYQLLYKIDIPVQSRFNDAAERAACYLVDNSGRLGTRPARVAYMLDLDGKWVWTSFKSLAKTTAYLGVPWNNIVQGRVEAMDVASNVDGIPTGTQLASGLVEFCSGDYQTAAAMGLGNGSIYDFDDTLKADRGGHGCMQVHDAATGTTLWSVCHFNKGNTVGLGIGNDPERKSNATDWTFQANAAQYTTRTLYVLVNDDDVADTYDESLASGSTALNHVVAAKDGRRVAVSFRAAPSQQQAAVSNFAIEGARIVSAEISAQDDRDVILTLEAPLAAGSANTLVHTSGGVKQEMAFAVMGAASSVLAAVSEAADYELVYAFDVPASFSSYYCPSYTADESRFGEIGFDRVAYLMELTRADGTAQWAWASMDAFTSDVALLGVPTPWRPGSIFQCYVENLVVAGGSSTGTAPVKTGSFSEGNIEFWPNSYTAANELGVSGASDSAYDFGDRISGNGYGSMQIHNYLNRETVMSLSHFYDGSAKALTPSIGIGNDTPDPNHDGSTDWTFRENAKDYTVRKLSVFVRRSAAASQGNGPLFTVQPQNATTKVGGDAVVLTAYAPGAAFYQWRKNGQLLVGETGSTLEIVPLKSGDAVYDVVAYRDGANCTLSAPATVHVATRGTLLLCR